MIDNRKWDLERLKEDNKELINHLRGALAQRLPSSIQGLEGYRRAYNSISKYCGNDTVSKVYQEVAEEINRKIGRLK